MDLQIIKHKIYTIRGQQVMLDFDLAELYEVETRVLKQAVRRNKKRFPVDFMFQLTKEELANLRSQTVTSSWGGLRYTPFAFTEQGVAMLSSILRSEKALQINIAIMRAFVALRHYARSYENLEKQIAELEARFQREFADIHEALRWLAAENQARTDDIAGLQETDESDDDWEKRKRIGFKKES